MFSLGFPVKLRFQWKLQNFVNSWIELAEEANILQQMNLAHF